MHALHGDGIYRNFFVNTKRPKAPFNVSGAGMGRWGRGGGGEDRGAEDPGRRIVFHRVFPGYIDFSYFDSVDLRGTKRTIYSGKNVPLCEDAGDECICFSFLFLFFFFPFFDRMARWNGQSFLWTNVKMDKECLLKKNVEKDDLCLRSNLWFLYYNLFHLISVQRNWTKILKFLKHKEELEMNRRNACTITR